MITLRKGGFIMIPSSPKFKIRIDNIEMFNFLTETNGVEPTQWFITKNGGKNKKDVFAYILNNTPEYIQLIAIKGKKKKCYIDKESIVTYSKTEDIESLTVVRSEFYEIRIKLKNSIKYVLGAFPFGADKFHKEAMKAFRVEYKEVSKKVQASTTVRNVLIYLVSIVLGVNVYFACEKIGTRYIVAKYIQNTIESGEYKEELSVVLKSYDKQNLKLDGNYTTIKAGNFRFNLPEGYGEYISDYDYEESTLIAYDCKIDKGIKRVIVDTEVLDGREFTDFDETLGDACEKEFGFRIDSQYNWEKLMWSIDYYNGDINYFDPEELVLYYSMLSTKAAMVGAVTETYEVETPTYKGIMLISENSSNNTLLIMLNAYAHNDLNTSYRITTIVPQTNIDEAYKILNSVELVTE